MSPRTLTRSGFVLREKQTIVLCGCSCWRKRVDPHRLSRAFCPSSTTRASLMSPHLRSSHLPSHPHSPVTGCLSGMQVLCRVFAGMTPVRVSLTDALHPNPDLYGPFWLCATLIFSIAVSGNIARVFRFSGTSSCIVCGGNR